MTFTGKQLITFYITAFLLACPLIARTGEVLYTAEYEGKHSGLTVKTTRSLVRTEDNSYLFTSVAKAMFASIEEISHFKLENNRLVPLSYRYKRSIFGVKKEEDITFDWQEKTATYQEGGNPEKATVHEAYAGLLDPSLYQLQLQRDMLNGNAGLQYNFVREQRIKNYEFDVVGRDKLKIDGKVREAVKLERLNDDSKKTVIWLIPEFHYQMGKIQHTEDGDQHEMTMTSYSSNPALFGELLRQDSQSPASSAKKDAPDQLAE